MSIGIFASVSIIGYGLADGHKNRVLWCRRLTVHATSIFFMGGYFTRIRRGICRRFAEGVGVSIIDVSNDGEISYVLHKYEFINSLC